MKYYNENIIKSLSINEITKTLIKELKNNPDYSCIYEVEESLLKQGLSKEVVNDLIVRTIGKEILMMNEDHKRIPHYEIEYLLKDLVKKQAEVIKMPGNKKIYRIKVSLDGVDDKIYRIYDITATSYLSTVAYMILGSFNTLAYHLYSFNINGDIYHCGIAEEDIDGYEIDAKRVTLNQLNLQKEDKFHLTYDFGCDWQFTIQVLDILEKNKEKTYPYIVEGKGKGIIEDEGIFTLQEIIKENDKGKKVYKYDDDFEIEFDYKEFDLEKLNQDLSKEIRKIKNGFEKY